MLRFQNGVTVDNRFYRLDVEILNFLSHALSVTSVNALVLAISSHNKIKILNLGENDITDEMIPLICQYLISNKDSHLEQLDLGGNCITETGAQLLLQALLSNNSLTMLNLDGNNGILNPTIKSIQKILNRNKLALPITLPAKLYP